MNKKDGKMLGILGGMGPEATVLFYRMVVRHTEALEDQDHIDMVIYNHATIPDRTGMVKAQKIDVLAQTLITDAKKLEAFGADCLVLTCNTSHVVADEIQAAINIPLINMIKETAAECDDLFTQRPAKLAVLATDGTIESRLYQRELEARGIEAYVPRADNQKLIMRLIYDIKSGKDVDVNDYIEVEKELHYAGCRSAVLGCTELSVLKERFGLAGFMVDALQVLVKRVIAFAGKTYIDR